ncbi:uncharacterized protein IL334_005141 [Kwoniella shivajii]|uniref:HpcH/HpaI aldolase/citrate lyase domain-containing protein n=1 Tax=Kwoniella shivajii TaxID=564305 RepID=A0ABZ1D5B1_9TREE|nr:hypothetical protein IL334_005141 [Kwoniella shivajii]
MVSAKLHDASNGDVIHDDSRHRLVLLNKLDRKQPAYGTFLMLSSAWTSRIVAQAGWDTASMATLTMVICTIAGLMIPMINTADQARAVVQASKFPPNGVRGQGSPFASTAHGMTTPEYLSTANRNVLTIIQIESQAGLANVEEICQVDGIDALFIGPNDLSMSLFN